MNFEVRLEKIFKQLKLLRFAVELGHRCCERLWQFGNCVAINNKICLIFVVCQLLKCEQKLVSLDGRRGIFSAELRLTGKAVLFLLSRRCIRGAVGDFLVNSCHHVVANFWAKLLCSVAAEEACFRIKTTLGAVLIRSLVCAKCVPGRLRSKSAVALNWRFHEKVVEMCYRAYAVFRPAKPWRQVLSGSCFNSLGNLSYIVCLRSGNFRILRHNGPRTFLKVCFVSRSQLPFLLCVAFYTGKAIVREWKLFVFLERKQIVVFQSCNSGNINTGYYQQYHQVIKVSTSVLSFLLFIPFPDRKYNFLLRPVKVQIRKSTL